MRKYGIGTVILGLLFLMMVTLISAQDDNDMPNDPLVNEDANACYADGTMADKCQTEWAWECGWYLIRWEATIFSDEQMPERCQILLPVPEIPQMDNQTGPPSVGVVR